jgi:hypothetical protein
VAGVAIAATLTLTACASLGERVHDALDAAASATTSAALALELRDSGQALRPLTDTALGDALAELDGATTDLTGSGPTTDAAAGQARDDALDAIRVASDAVQGARDAVAAGDDLGASIDAVHDAADALSALADQRAP